MTDETVTTHLEQARDQMTPEDYAQLLAYARDGGEG